MGLNLRPETLQPCPKTVRPQEPTSSNSGAKAPRMAIIRIKQTPRFAFVSGPKTLNPEPKPYKPSKPSKPCKPLTRALNV